MLYVLKRLIGNRNPLRLGYHWFRAFLAAAWYRFPARHLTVVGITGTDGKTTTVGMAAHILHEEDIAVGALSTAFFRIREEIDWNATQKTSPSPFIIQRFLRRLVRAGCTHAVLEYSSHGLVQQRTAFTWPRIAAITNTSMEHLDYHGTMERYRQDKAMLFRQAKTVHVLNADDETYMMYKDIPAEKTLTYSQRPLGNEAIGFWTSDIVAAPGKTDAKLHGSYFTETWDLTLRIPGIFNLENALCAIAAAHAAGVPVARCAAALSSFRAAAGRMERIDAGQPFSVYVDFTVTPNAYRKTLTALREMIEPGKRILVLAGSCGDRMREKRPEVGRVCSELADVVVVANEDPYTEDPQKIIEDVWEGVDQSQTEAHRIFDRREAMAFLFRQAQPGDAVLLAGKGSDTTMMTATGQVPWDERAIARELLQAQRK
ncbi:UDP-N-acetylmuramyl-tripeptide synthetase [Candidatus Peribacteria bacterium]|nr:UDP-N-acetylmuramyl-tripeptide synthetase [Candidatus Peribacteria bacterium]